MCYEDNKSMCSSITMYLISVDAKELLNGIVWRVWMCWGQQVNKFGHSKIYVENKSICSTIPRYVLWRKSQYVRPFQDMCCGEQVNKFDHSKIFNNKRWNSFKSVLYEEFDVLRTTLCVVRAITPLIIATCCSGYLSFFFVSGLTACSPRPLFKT